MRMHKEIDKYMNEMGAAAKKASAEFSTIESDRKNQLILNIGKQLNEDREKILKSNEIDIKNAKELEDEARKPPCENCGKPMELYCGETFGAWYFRCSKSPNCKGKRQILGSN